MFIRLCAQETGSSDTGNSRAMKQRQRFRKRQRWRPGSGSDSRECELKILLYAFNSGDNMIAGSSVMRSVRTVAVVLLLSAIAWSASGLGDTTTQTALHHRIAA